MCVYKSVNKCVYVHMYIYTFIYKLTKIYHSQTISLILGAELARERFYHHLLTSDATTMTQNAKTNILPNRHIS